MSSVDHAFLMSAIRATIETGSFDLKLCGPEEEDRGLTEVSRDVWGINVKTIDFSHNRLSSLPSLPDNCPALERLRVVNLAHNRFISVPESLKPISYFEGLDLSHNSGIITLPEWLLEKTIIHLDLTGTAITQTTLDRINRVKLLIYPNGSTQINDDVTISSTLSLPPAIDRRPTTFTPQTSEGVTYWSGLLRDDFMELGAANTSTPGSLMDIESEGEEEVGEVVTMALGDSSSDISELSELSGMSALDL